MKKKTKLLARVAESFFILMEDHYMTTNLRYIETVFDCPYCNAVKVGCRGENFLDLDNSDTETTFSELKFYQLTCNNCQKKFIVIENYLPEDKTDERVIPIDKSGVVGVPRITASNSIPIPQDVPVSHQILFPINARNSSIPAADPSMPEELKKMYNEAASVFDLSPRSSAALIRLTLEAYLKYYYNRDRGNLYRMIEMFTSKNNTPKIVNKIMDIIREEGNDNVHPNLDNLRQELGNVNQEAKKEEILPLFNYINYIARMLSVLESADADSGELNNN